MAGEIFGNFFKEFSQALNPQAPETEIEVRSYKRDEIFAKEIRPIIVDLEQVIRALSDLEKFSDVRNFLHEEWRGYLNREKPNEARASILVGKHPILMGFEDVVGHYNMPNVTLNKSSNPGCFIVI